MTRLILASQSPYRRQLLEQLGVAFDTSPAHIDEEKYQREISDVYELTAILARKKAEKVFESNPDAVVIGSDQALAMGSRIFNKPGTVENAIEQLSAMAGKTHQLITAVCLKDPKNCIEFTHTTSLTMRKLDPEAIKRYIESDKPLDCAGSYKIEARGITLFEKIETTDHNSIIGLPLIELTTHLLQLGFKLP